MALCVFFSASLSGCATAPGLFVTPPETAKISPTRETLIDLPPPSQPIPIAVYGITDQTGQFKPVENIQTLSRAISQGASSILVQALRDAGHGRWFTVLERERVDNLLKERQIISDTRARYLGETRPNPEALPALLFAGVLLEGGIIGYDSDTTTGGIGAKYLGIGANVSYRQDTITIYLRAAAVKTGEILSSVVTRKTIVSVGLSSGAFRYVAFQDLLETEAGFTVNEPEVVALEQAIEKATYDLVLDGANTGLWSFENKVAAAPMIKKYLSARGLPPNTQVAAERTTSGAQVGSSATQAAPQFLAGEFPVQRQADAVSLKPVSPSTDEHLSNEGTSPKVETIEEKPMSLARLEPQSVPAAPTQAVATLPPKPLVSAASMPTSGPAAENAAVEIAPLASIDATPDPAPTVNPGVQTVATNAQNSSRSRAALPLESANNSSFSRLTAAVTPREASEMPAPESISGRGSAEVQIGSYRSEDLARSAWNSFHSRYGDVVGSLDFNIKKAAIGSNEFSYRVRLGPLAGKAVAEGTCREIKEKGGNCYVVVH